MSRRGWVLFGAMGVIWGIPYLFIKIAVGELSPVSLVFLRTGAGALLLLPVALSRGGLPSLLPRWRWLVIYTVVEIAVPWLLLSDAERHLTSSLTGLLLAAVPLIGALLAQLLGSKDRLRPLQAGGLLIGFAGVAALVGVDVSRSDLGAGGEMAVVAICYAVGPVIIARRLADVPALGVVTASLALTAIGYIPAGVLQLPSTLPSWQVLVSVAVLAVVCTALAFIVFFALIAEVGPVRATIITYVNPAVALLLGVLIRGEPVTAATIVGFVLIISGSVLATRRAPQPPPPRAREPVPIEAEPSVASP